MSYSERGLIVNRFSPGKLFRLRVIVPLAFLILVVSIFPAVTATRAATIKSSFRQHVKFLASTPQPPTDAQCRAQTGFPCYSPQEIRKAYGVTPLLDKGYTGKGQSIVIIDSFGSPTIQQDLKTFDAGYGLPDPPYMLIFVQALSLKGWQGSSLLETHCRGKA